MKRKIIKGIPIIDCFGTKKYKILKSRIERKLFYPHGPSKTFRAVKVYNEKLGVWVTEPMIEHFARCPVCGKLIFVRAIFGTTYYATCSDKCLKKLLKKARELGHLHEAIISFDIDPLKFTKEDLKKMKEFMKEYRKKEVGV